jgi:Ser/Thr protein kinase RdoA (MazF antagonist)
MMKLSTMWKIDATVSADGCSPVAERILTHWPHDAGSLRFFRSSANFLYTFNLEGKRYFLRFADSSERSRQTIEAEVTLLNWLASAGIHVAVPLPADNGEFVVTIETVLGTFHAVVFPELSGVQMEMDLLDAAGYGAWGAALGGLHAALKEFPGQASAERPTWRDELEQAHQYLPTSEPAIQREWASLSRELDALPVDREGFGLIHYDFELDNLVWGENGIGILDFDDCVHHWYAADIAFALRDLFANGRGLDDPSFRAFMDGYASQCLLDEASIQQVPLFLRFSKLVQYARMARSLDLEAVGSYPDWLRGLEGKLRSRMTAYAVSLEDQAN